LAAQVDVLTFVFMSHRVYLYNVNTPSAAKENDKMMMEWGYEMPLLLQPLLINGAFITGNNYNNHTEESDAGLYYDAKPGIENLKRFYNFLETQDAIISDKAAFAEAKNSLFKYLDSLEHPYFNLDMWDVFNMEETPHEDQAATWLADIAFNNAVITKAMDNNDISLLPYNELKNVSMAFQTFEDLLNYGGYNYGWGHIYEEIPTQKIYQENELWGLKAPDGAILLPPQFDEFYEFSAQGLAVVMKAGKYGYVHTSGKIAIPLEWDDAFDFEYSFLAVVKRNDLLGLINMMGGLVTPLEYEDIESFGNDGRFIAQKNGKWGMLGQDGKVIMDFDYEKIVFLQDDVFIMLKDNFWRLSNSDDQFDHIARKAPHPGFAYAFKDKDVYLVDKYGLSRANKGLVQQEAGGEYYHYYYDDAVRDRLLAYAASPDSSDIIDAYTPVEDLYNIGVDAFNSQDYQSAIHYYTLAAEKGYGYAMNNLAHIYYMIDDYTDPDKAFYWYEKGAAESNTNALNGLSLCYQNGIGTIPDIDKAISLLQEAANDGLAVAHNNLGFLLFGNDPEQALYHYQQAEELGEPDNGWLGYMYEMTGDFDKAIQYYRKDETEIGAFNLGNLYLKGLGTAKDVKAAIDCFKTAVEGGHDAAHIELARIYLSEFIDLEQAAIHIAEAEKAGLEIPDDLKR
jgi:TPR repeat protein